MRYGTLILKRVLERNTPSKPANFEGYSGPVKTVPKTIVYGTTIPIGERYFHLAVGAIHLD